MAASTTPVVDLDVDASVPLPESVARGLSPFHRLMRSRCIGLVLFAIVSVVLAMQPLVAVAPILLFVAWIRVVDVRGMQRFFDRCSGWYMAIVMFWLETIFGIRIRMFGHSGRFERRSLVIMNHICHFDWLYFWGVMEHSGDLTSWKAITKDAIKKAPLVGICMQYMVNIFISRRWETDEKEFKKKLYYYNAIDLPVQVMLFPEGGDLTSKSKAKSDAFADANNLKRYDRCLHPRSRGFLYVMEALRSGGLDAVYDITVGYPDALAKEESNLLSGEYIPREIHYNICHYKAEDLPTDEQGLTQWLYERWEEKENMLKLFYAHKHFVEPVPKLAQNGVSTRQNGHTEYRPVQEVLRPKSYLFTTGAFAFYVTMLFVFSYFFYVCWIWRYCVYGMGVFTLVKGLSGGIDNVLPDSVPDRIEAAYNKCHRVKETGATIYHMPHQ